MDLLQHTYFHLKWRRRAGLELHGQSAVSMKNGPCWNDGEDFAVNVREVEEEEPN